MNNAAKFKQRLAGGETLLGTALSLADPTISDALADSVDFFWLDLEHSPMSPEAVRGHIIAARGRGVPLLVRVTGNNASFIKPILDAGADGIIAPQIRGADEARAVVAECRYPPVGRRGYGPFVPSNYGRSGGPDYLERANRDIFVAVQIETVQAYKEIGEIVAIPGLDSIALGPWDFSINWGLPGQVEHPEVLGALMEVITKARAAGKFVGMGMGPDAGYATRMIQRGCQWLQVGGDYSFMIAGADQTFNTIRANLNSDTTPQATDGGSSLRY